MDMKAHLQAICLVFCFFGTVRPAAAEYQTLTEPGLAFRSGYSESARSNLMACLRRADCQFVGGSSLNAFTSLRYSGTTTALNLFLEGLANCPGVTLSVLFQNTVDDKSDWMVTQNAHEPGRIAVRVNLKSTRIKLDTLVIPEINGPTIPQTK